MVLWWLFGIGMGLLALAGYCGIKYGNVPSKFEYERYDVWLRKHLQKHPDAENEEVEKWMKKNPTGARIDPWLKETYLKEIKIGKLAIPVFGSVGGILTAISSVF